MPREYQPLTPEEVQAAAVTDAIAWVRATADVVTGETDILQAERIASTEFATAGVAARVIVADKALLILKVVEEALLTGAIPQGWDNPDTVGHIITTGMQDYDPRIMFQASLRTAYSAGRYERAMDSLEDEPYFCYRTMRDSRVRTTHQKLNGVVLPKTDDFWRQHYPPNGWRCRCKAYSLDERGIEKLKKYGIPIQDVAPEEAMKTYTNNVTGEKETLPESIEPGWGFAPGSAGSKEQLEKLLNTRLSSIHQKQ